MIYREEIRDLFTVPEDYHLAHCISADFGMGAGIVIEFNKRFDMKNILHSKYPDYLKWFKERELEGDCILEGRVLNLITKRKYYGKPTMYTMKVALERMKYICYTNNITKIAMPTIGAGLDKLIFEDVSKLIKDVFYDTDIEILVCKLK